MWIPCSASFRNELRPLITRAPTTAPQRLVAPPTTSIASVMKVSGEVDLVGGDRAELVHEQAAGEPGQRAADHERDQPLPVDVDAGRLGGLRILAGRTQLPARPAQAVGERDDDRDQRADEERPDPALGNERERRHAGADLLPVADQVVGDPEHGEGRDARGQAREAHQRDADEEREDGPRERGERERRHGRDVGVAQEREHGRASRSPSARRRASGSRTGRRRRRRS